MNDVSFTVRPAAPRDAALLTTFRVALFRELGELELPERATALERQSFPAFTTYLERGICYGWLAETAASGPVGSVTLFLFPRFPSPASPSLMEGYLGNVYIVPEYRRSGVATALVKAAIAKGRELGLARIRLHTSASGQPVYTALGFELRTNEMELTL